MNPSSPDHLTPDQTLAKWDQLHGHSEVTRSVVALRERLPEVDSITAEVIHGVIVDGVTIEVHGYFDAPRIEVKAKTADAACDLMLRELERARSERQSYVWPPRFDD